MAQFNQHLNDSHFWLENPRPEKAVGSRQGVLGQKPRFLGLASRLVPHPGKDVVTEPHPPSPEVPESWSGPTTCSSNTEGTEKLLECFRS